jgi:hypothetical protein
MKAFRSIVWLFAFLHYLILVGGCTRTEPAMPAQPQPSTPPVIVPPVVSALPDCPCQYSLVKDGEVTVSPAGKWTNSSRLDRDFYVSTRSFQRYHFGATTEARWTPNIQGPGQQCTYDAAGKLITGGLAAGSMDKQAPGSTQATSCDHYEADMLPWGDTEAIFCAFQADPAKVVPCLEYMKGWTANNGKNCETNIVTPINHLLPMIKTLSCSDISRIMTEAAGSTTIHPELKDYLFAKTLKRSNSVIKSWLIEWKKEMACHTLGAWTVCNSIEKAINNLGPFEIGDTAFGGIIVYFADATQEHGIVMATNNQSTFKTCWDPFQLPDPNASPDPKVCGASGTAIGTGRTNTNKIISTIGLGNNAASECINYRGGRFADWYLPSKDELDIMFKNRTSLKLTERWYWSSSEIVRQVGTRTISVVWVPDAVTGLWNDNEGKYSMIPVRAVRTF